MVRVLMPALRVTASSWEVVLAGRATPFEKASFETITSSPPAGPHAR